MYFPPSKYAYGAVGPLNGFNRDIILAILSNVNLLFGTNVSLL